MTAANTNGTETNVIDQARESATAALKDSLAMFEAEETRLAGELARVKDQRKNVAKALSSIDPDATPKRRRGRPRKTAEPAAA